MKLNTSQSPIKKKETKTWKEETKSWETSNNTIEKREIPKPKANQKKKPQKRRKEAMFKVHG